MTLSARAAWLLLVPILLAYGYLAVGYARATPRWNNPDEPAHVNVIRQIATTGTLPVLTEGDWDKPLLDRPMRLTGHLLADTHLFQVLTVRSVVKGMLHEPHWWCDVCAIKRFEPKDCECCGAPMEYREEPVGK